MCPARVCLPQVTSRSGRCGGSELQGGLCCRPCGPPSGWPRRLQVVMLALCSHSPGGTANTAGNGSPNQRTPHAWPVLAPPVECFLLGWCMALSSVSGAVRVWPPGLAITEMHALCPLPVVSGVLTSTLCGCSLCCPCWSMWIPAVLTSTP